MKHISTTGEPSSLSTTEVTQETVRTAVNVSREFSAPSAGEREGFTFKMEISGGTGDTQFLFQQLLSKLEPQNECDIPTQQSVVFPAPKLRDLVDEVHCSSSDLALSMKQQFKDVVQKILASDNLKSRPYKTCAALIMMRALEFKDSLTALRKLLEVMEVDGATGPVQVQDWVMKNLIDRPQFLHHLPHPSVEAYIAYAKTACEEETLDYRRRLACQFLEGVMKAKIPEFSSKIDSWLKDQWEDIVNKKRHDNGARSIYQLLTELATQGLISEVCTHLSMEEVARHFLTMDIYSGSDWERAFTLLDPDQSHTLARRFLEGALTNLHPNRVQVQYSIEKDLLEVERPRCKLYSCFSSYMWPTSWPEVPLEQRLLEGLPLTESKNLRRLLGILIFLANKDTDSFELLRQVLEDTGSSGPAAAASVLVASVEKELAKRDMDSTDISGLLELRLYMEPDCSEKPLRNELPQSVKLLQSTRVQALILEQAFRNWDFQKHDVDSLGRTFESIMSSKVLHTSLCKRAVPILLRVLAALDREGACIEFATRRLALTALHNIVVGPQGTEASSEMDEEQQDSLNCHIEMWYECLTDIAGALLGKDRHCTCGDKFLRPFVNWCLTTCPDPQLRFDMLTRLVTSGVDVEDISLNLITSTLTSWLSQRESKVREEDRTPVLKLLRATVKREKGLWRHGPVLDFLLLCLTHNSREEHLLCLDVWEEVGNEILSLKPESTSLPAAQFRLSMLVYTQVATALVKSATDVDAFIQERACSMLLRLKSVLGSLGLAPGLPTKNLDTALADFMGTVDHHRLKSSDEAEAKKYDSYSLPSYRDAPVELVRAMTSTPGDLSNPSSRVNVTPGPETVEFQFPDSTPLLTLTGTEVANLESLFVQVLSATEHPSASQKPMDKLADMIEDLWLEICLKDVQPCMDCE